MDLPRSEPALVALAEAVKNAEQQRAIIEGTWKLLADPQANRLELFNLQDDPSEQRNLAALHVERVQRLRAILQAQLDENERLGRNVGAQDAEVSEEELRQFQAIGYFGGGEGPPGDKDNLADPINPDKPEDAP